jgi:hypothetical protein
LTLRLPAVVAALLILSAPLLLFTGSASAEPIDTGYRPWVNGFSFQNSGDAEAFYGVDLGALAGPDFHDEIFRHTGHCYGMASASVEDFLANRSSMDMSIETAMPRLDRIQTEQSFYYIADYARSPFGGSSPGNRAEYEKIMDRLASGRPAVIGVYYSGGGHPGHAVVAYRADTIDNKTLLSVYDPNLPPALYPYEETPLTAVYDIKNGSFWYDNGQPFDQVRLDDISQAGVAGGKALTAGVASLPCAFIFVLALLRFPPRP